MKINIQPRYIFIKNNGPEIEETNFWDSDAAQKGTLFVSISAGTLRLLVPRSLENQIPEMKTGRTITISRGPWPAMGRTDALEILFDDGSDYPFAVQLGTESFDRFPSRDDVIDNLALTIWVQAANGNTVCVWNRPCSYRVVSHLPSPKS